MAYQFPYVAPYFATARAVIGIPIGIMIKLFGESEFTVVLSTCLFYAATVSLTMAALSRLTGLVEATITSCLIATIPMFALKPTIPSADQTRTIFCYYFGNWAVLGRNEA